MISISILKALRSFCVFFSSLCLNFVVMTIVQFVKMFEQWRAYNHSIKNNLEDDEEEKYMINQFSVH